MKNLFASKDERITEKAFSQSLVISVVSILLCLVALCSMTYAWFSSDTSSGGNKLEAGCFDLSVCISYGDGEAASEIIPTKDDSGVWNCTLDTAGTTYTVTLKLTDKTNVKGYCIVTIDGKEYRTDAIVNTNTVSEAYPEVTAPFTFKIKTEKPSTEVKFEAIWGAPAEPVVGKGETIPNEALLMENEDAVGE